MRVTFGATLEDLVGGCVDVLRVPLADPFTADWVAIPTGGVRGWLQRRLAQNLGATGPDTSDGVTANIDFVQAKTLRQRLVDARTGARTAAGTPTAAGTRADGGDPWSIAAMQWALMAIAAGDHTLEPMVGNQPLAVWARVHAARFDRYHVHRPDLIRSWLADPPDLGDGTESEQAELYRLLAARIGAPNPVAAIDEVIRQFATGEQPVGSELPERLIFFGFTLPPDGAWFTTLARVLRGRTEIHAFLLDPAPAVTPEARTGLSATWGRSASGVRRLLDGEPLGETVELAPATGNTDGDLLARLQRHIASGTTETAPADATDRSIVLHRGQGIRRQIEMLRDEILHRLAADDTLREEDIVVYCGDPKTVAPMLASVLGPSTPTDERPGGRPGLRYHVDGLPTRFRNPVADAFVVLLEMLTGRITSVDLLRFCQLDAVRNRWGFDEDDVATFRRWTVDLNIRWGLNPEHRSRFDIPPEITFGTWRRALTRLAAGVAHASDDLVLDGPAGRFAPVPVEGDDLDRLGRLDDLVCRLEELSRDITLTIPATERLERLAEAVPGLFAADPGRPEQLDEVLTVCRMPREVADTPWNGPQDFDVGLAGLRPLLIRDLERHGGSSGVFRGGIIVTTPAATRGVPFRIVALLDLDDSWIPAGSPDAADLIARSAGPGDPEPRDEARLALLSAILSAGDALVLTRDRRSPTTNEDLPEGIVVGELLDTVDTLVDGPDDRPGRTMITTDHPLSALDPDSFDPTGPLAVDDEPWSFDPMARDIAAAIRDRTDRPRPHQLGDTPTHRLVDRPDIIELDDLRRFLRAPDRYVCRETFGIGVPRDEEDPDDHLPTELGPLEGFRLRQTILEALADGTDTDELRHRLQATDRLPVGAAGDAVFAEAERIARLMHDEAAEHRHLRTETTIDVDVALADGRRLVGSVPAFVSEENRDGVLFDMRMSASAKTGDLIASLATLHAVSRTRDDLTWWSLVLRRGSRSSPVEVTGQCLPATNPAPATTGRGAPPEPHDGWPMVLDRLIGAFDVARLGAVPLPSDHVGKTGKPGSRPEDTFARSFLDEPAIRLLHGYRDPAELVGSLGKPLPQSEPPVEPLDGSAEGDDHAPAVLPVHPDDPAAGTRSDDPRMHRMNHLWHVIFREAIGTSMSTGRSRPPRLGKKR